MIDRLEDAMEWGEKMYERKVIRIANQPFPIHIMVVKNDQSMWNI
jgi:hypothetical protein